MNNPSIGKLPPSGEFTFASGRKSDFTRAKTQYYKYVQQLQQAGSFNYPATMETERSMLTELKELAKKERLSSENDWISAREAEINTLITDFKVRDLSNLYYLPPNTMQSENEKSAEKEVILDLLNLFKLPDGSFDKEGELILNSFKEKNQPLSNIKKIISLAQKPDNSISRQVAEVIKTLNECNISSSCQIDLLEEFTSYNNQNKDIDVDLKAFETVKKLSGFNLSSGQIINFAKFFKSEFENEDLTFAQISKLLEAEISPETVSALLNELSVKNSEGKVVITPESINSVIALKKSLVKFRDNEVNERNCPINKIGVDVIEYSKNEFFIMKDGKVIYSKPAVDENPQIVKENYMKMVETIENDFLLDFVKTYKENSGALNSNALRLFSALRKSGIVYNHLLPLIDFCLDKDEINQNKLKCISLVKSSGALSSDVINLLNSIPVEENGDYDKASLSDVCDLSSAVIDADNVISLLPIVHSNPEIKAFFNEFSPFFSDKSNLIRMADILKNENSQIASESLHAASALRNNIESNYSANDREKAFLKALTKIMNLIKNSSLNSKLSALFIDLMNENSSFEETMSAVALHRISDNSEKNIDEIPIESNFVPGNEDELN